MRRNGNTTGGGSVANAATDNRPISFQRITAWTCSTATTCASSSAVYFNYATTATSSTIAVGDTYLVRHHVPKDFEGPHETAEAKSWWADKERVRKASKRARRLLLEHLSAEQRREYRRKQRFYVQGPSGSTYLVERRRYGNVARVEGGKRVEVYCLHVNDGVPNEDNILAQKMWLESEREQEFIASANRHHPETWSREIAA